MEGVAQCSQSHMSKLNYRWTALGRVLWVRCGEVVDWVPVGQLTLSHQQAWLRHGCGPDEVKPGKAFAYWWPVCATYHM